MKREVRHILAGFRIRRRRTSQVKPLHLCTKAPSLRKKQSSTQYLPIEFGAGVMLVKSLLFAVIGFGSIVKAQFGLTDNDDSYVVNAGSANSLAFTVDKAGCDVISIVYRGTELQYSSTFTHINSGLGSATAAAEVIDSESLTFARRNINNISPRPVCQGHLPDRQSNALYRGRMWREQHVHGNVYHSRAGDRRTAIHCPP